MTGATALSVHEAAHVIIARLFGLRLTRFDREENGTEAEAFFDEESSSAAARNLEDALIATAGEFAERMAKHRPTADDIKGDRAKMATAVRDLDTRGDLDRVRTQSGIRAICDAFLHRVDVWSAVSDLAEFLNENPSADAAAINDYVDRLRL